MAGQKQPGFYVAHHRWFDAEYGPGGLYKVGHTDDLRRRLVDSGYTTCFVPGFSYVCTFETQSKEDARRLEAAVLHCTASRRVAREDTAALSELVRMELGELVALANRAAEVLGIEGTSRARPSYPRPPARRPAPPSAGAALSADSAADGGTIRDAADAAKLAGLVVPPQGDREPGERRGNYRPGQLDSYVADLFAELSLEGAAAAELPSNKTAAAQVTSEPTAAQSVSELVAAQSASELVAARPASESAAGADSDESEVDLEALGVDFEALDVSSYESFENPLEDRPYQTAAIAAALRELAATRRTVLQMACRCGKTRVAHGVILDYLGRAARPPAARRNAVLYLVPGLALLRQTAQKLDRYGIDADVLLVGSDERPLEKLASLRPASGAAVAAATTDPAKIQAACEGAGPRPLLVISTYQSSPLLPDAFDLSVFDESHRVCGDTRPRPFTHVLLNHEGGDRLYMTATPRYDAPLSMKDRARFGGVAYAYHMREGIDAGYVNDFELELVGAAAAGVDDKDATAAQVVAAFGRLAGGERGNCGKLLVFCRSINHAAALCREVGAALQSAAACLCAHSRMPGAEIAKNLARFCAPGEPAVLFNCRLFQEGVEIPTLNGVFFAAPRHSPRDIIQSLCRPLNVLPGKPPSKVFIPVVYDPAAAPDAPANLERFASIVPYFDALVAEDPLLYEHLLDPRGTPYPLEWVDSACAGAKPMRYRPGELLAAARRSVRRGGSGKTERLLRAAKIPWEIGFGELRRVVTECGRYPKTSDSFAYGDAKVNFCQFYKYASGCYSKWQAGEAQPLEPHQLRALAELPSWEPYGIEGPYPWKEALAFLNQWLAEHDGELPMFSVGFGEYIGLEATPMERLSGAMRTINQQDGNDRKGSAPGSGFTVPEYKQKDLDELCAKWGLRWRKDRHPPPPGAPAGSVGSLVVAGKTAKYAGARTFIQEASRRFNQEWKTRGRDSVYLRRWFPDYPAKHQRQERLDVWARRKEIVPPRWRARKKSAAN